MYDGMRPMTASPPGIASIVRSGMTTSPSASMVSARAHGRDGLFHGEDLGDELLVGDQDLHENPPFW